MAWRMPLLPSSLPAALALLVAGSIAGVAAIGVVPSARGGGREAAEETVDGSVPSVDRARHLILITIDTLRADALGFAGNAEAATPSLDRLAGGGRVFERAYAHNVVTLPSHANILTGLYPYQHGVRSNGGFKLRGDIPTLATTLAEAGFATAAFVGAFPLDARFGLERGFGTYDDELSRRSRDQLFAYSERPGAEVVSPAQRWWTETRDRRRFLWIHLFDPHAPYAPPAPFDEGFAGRPYLGEVAAVDGALAPLLEGFLSGGEEPTLIVFTADHGESLGQHGELTHGLFAYEPTLRVPLVLWGPGVEPGRDRRLARHIDLLPTALAGLGLPPPAALPGRSLLADLTGVEETSSYFEALSGNLDLGWAPLRGVVAGATKFIDLPIPELYALDHDPDESENLYPLRPETAKRLASMLPAESVWPPAAGEISAEEAERLRSLGYLSGSGPPRPRQGYTVDDDPKRLVGLNRKLNLVARLSLRGRLDEAIALAREVVAARSDIPIVYDYLVALLLRKGDHGQALDVMRAAQTAGVASRELLQQLGLTLVWVGRPGEALSVLEGLASRSRDAETLNHLALALSALGRHEEAVARLDEVLAADPADARAWENLSFIDVERQRFAPARDHARRALELDPERASSWNNLGAALFGLGQPAEAMAAWERSLELDPTSYDSLFNVGVAAAESGDPERARTALVRFLAAAPPTIYEAERGRARELLATLPDDDPAER